AHTASQTPAAGKGCGAHHLELATHQAAVLEGRGKKAFQIVAAAHDKLVGALLAESRLHNRALVADDRNTEAKFDAEGPAQPSGQCRNHLPRSDANFHRTPQARAEPV